MDWSYVVGYFDGEGTAGVYKIARSSAPKVEITWHNTHLESLQRIRDFIGCGIIRERSQKKPGYPGAKAMYSLVVATKSDIARIVPLMIPLSIIKREALQNVLAKCDYLITPGKRGVVSALGVDEVRRLYHEEKLSTVEIGDRLGVTYGAVKYFMEKNDIARRNPAERATGRTWSDESRLKASEARKRLWSNPDYREKASSSMKGKKRSGGL